MLDNTRSAQAAVVVDGLHGRILVDGSGSGTVVWSGGGDADYLCGSCGVPLVHGATDSVVRTHAFRCRGCHCFNVLEV